MLRLDPFAFPADTSLRFLLLISFVLAWTVLLAIGTAMEFVDPVAQAVLAACHEELVASFDPGGTDLAQFFEAGAFGGCVAFFSAPARYVSVIKLTLVVTIAVAVYYTNHRWVIRRYRLVPLPLDAMPTLASTLADLCRRAGLARPVHFFWSPLSPHGARAFGRPGRPCVALGGGLVARLAREPGRFAVVVLHELAHHRNGDVGRTFAALAVWWALVLAALLPYGIVQIRRLAREPDIALWIWMNLQLLLVVSIVYLTRNALLRARELYADARVAGWVPQADVLAAMPEAPVESGGRRRWPAVPAVLLVHPSLRRRRRALEEPSSLLRASAWDVFATGLAAGLVIMPGLAAFAVLLGPEGFETEVVALAFAPVAAAFAPGAVAAGAVALMVWRMHLARRLAAGPPPPVARLALAFAVGAMVGLVVTRPFDRLLLAGDVPGLLLVTPYGRVASLVAAAGLAAALCLVLYGFLAWVRAAADAWLLPMLHTRRPWHLAVGVVGVGSLAVGSILGTLSVLFVALLLLLPSLGTPEALAPVMEVFGFGLLGAILLNPLMLLAVVLAVVLPMVAARWEAAGAPAALPAWIGGTGTASPLPARPRMRPGLALAIGLGAGALFFVLMPLALRMGLLDGLEALGVDLLVGFVAPAALWQAAVAGAVAVAVARHPVLHGLLAGFVAGVLAALALVVAPWPIAAVPAFDPWRMLQFLAYVLYPGTFLAWAAAALGAAIGRRRHGTPG